MESDNIKVILSLLKQINKKTNKNLREYFSDCALTIPQMTLLILLKQNGEMKISEISDSMGLTTSTISGIIDRLEKAELVKRIRNDEDRRVVKVIPLNKVADLKYDLEGKFVSYFTTLFSKASDEDLKDIIKGLEKFNKVLMIYDDIKGDKV